MTRILRGHSLPVFTLASVLLLACCSFLLSYLLRFDFEIPEYWLKQLFLVLPPVTFIKTGIYWLLRARLSNWRYLSGSTILFVCVYALACSSLVFVMDWLIPEVRIPKGVIIIDFLATVSLGVVVGLTLKTLAERFGGSFDSSRKRVQRAVIVGISNASEAYIMETKRTPGCDVEVEAIFDVDLSKVGSFIHGVPVRGDLEQLRHHLTKRPIDLVLLSLDPALSDSIRPIKKLLSAFHGTVKQIRPLLETVDRSLPLSRLDDTGLFELVAQQDWPTYDQRSERDPDFIPLAKPTLPELEDVFWIVKRSYASGMVTSGEVVKLFERELRSFTDVEHAIAVSSGTAGLMLVFSALNFPKGAEVILPSFTFAATVHALLWNGLTPVFVDCLPGRMTLDPEEVVKALSAKTAAIHPVTVFGLPPDLDDLEAVSQDTRIPLIFDSAQGLGATYAGRRLGGFGLCEVFSLSPTKAITSMEGGMITTNSQELADKLRSMRNYGKAVDGQEIVYMGLSARMVEIDAAVGLLNLRRAKSLLDNRMNLIHKYCERLKDIPGCSHQEFPPDRTPSGSHFAFRVSRSAAISRDGLIRELRARNIETRAYFSPPAHAHPIVHNRPHRVVGQLPVTWACSQECIALPLYSAMTEDDHDRVCTVVEEVLRRGHRAIANPGLP